MEELNIKNRTVISRAIKFRFVKPLDVNRESRVSREMQAKRACVVRGWARQEKRAYGSAIREGQTAKRVCGGGGSEKRRAFARLCDAARGEAHEKGERPRRWCFWRGLAAAPGCFSGGSVNGSVARRCEPLGGGDTFMQGGRCHVETMARREHDF